MWTLTLLPSLILRLNSSSLTVIFAFLVGGSSHDVQQLMALDLEW